MVASTCNDIELKRLLPLARQLGGHFVVRLRTDGPDHDSAVDWMLRDAGLKVVGRINHGHRTLVAAERSVAALAKAA